MKILVTGGAGYIGSHTCVELLNEGYEVVVIDNLCNSNEEALRRVQTITGKDLKFFRTDLRNKRQLEIVFEKEKIDTVIHFAGLKAVGESIENPLDYYENNLVATLVLCEVMRKFGCKSIIFSSSATVYGDPAFVPVTEKCPKGEITNPYAQTKSMLEQVLSDMQKADSQWNVVFLRYSNPIGAHPSGLIGEDSKGIPNNLLPYIAQVAIGKRECLNIFGNDYDTPDGTGVRDYLHVVDLAAAHVKALKQIDASCGLKIYNLGTGKGYSVLQIVDAYEKACGRKLNYKIVGRRPGDIGCYYADPTKAKSELGWIAQHGIEEMCADSWRWQRANPDGYENK